MTDIVKRLRAIDTRTTESIRDAWAAMLEAADEIERLRSALAADPKVVESRHAIKALQARIIDLEAQCEAGAASEQRWVEWLIAKGLLFRYSDCQRPDGTNGPAWILRKPAMVDGTNIEAWHPDTAAGALRAFLEG